VERAIGGIFDALPDAAFTTEELCGRVYPGVEIERKHRVAALRAANKLVAKRDTLGVLAGEGLGGQRVFFRMDSVFSYGLARLKADDLYHYQSRDSRILPWNIKTEEDLRAPLIKGGRYHKYMVRGGAWWKHVQSWAAERKARRSGNAERLKRVLAEREEHNAKILSLLGLNR
jgi:hypothetical protein